ncbi:DNA-3-methyladenine glycosylase I [Nonlabens xiamenensis]|uniref:DNA-3-methyladenine glycosylase I n=1 Tax=Nonlabens xiamenensis TaxID=2341043 RepID=UPI000F605515|nr:DNA-3-methyladenine glycosylase I [Nonlabens xiamenensis]
MNQQEKHRCGWCQGDALYKAYHDQEWGVPVFDDHSLFEFLILEGMQAGLSWITILRKRNNYREALDEFDVHKIAGYGESKKKELLENPGIIRNRLKIDSIVSNAQAYLKIQESYGSFSNFIWAYVDSKPIKNKLASYKDAPAQTALSQKISKDLKKLGFKFVGPTIVYAFMQAVGMVNDHEVNCFRYDQV